VKVIGLKKETNSGIKHYCSIKDKICIYRACGGYGDILMSRMIFEDLKTKYPNFKITYAAPEYYHQILKDHPFIDNLVDSKDLDKNKYRVVFNITHSCLKHEILHGKECDKNRSDIWAESFGLQLENHNMHMPNLEKNKSLIISNLKKHGYNEGQKIIVFTPYSAVPTRNLTENHRKIIEIILKKTNCFCFYLHSVPLLDQLNLPLIIGKNLIEAMSYIYFADALISTDTGHIHCAGGYNKKTLGLFNYANGKAVGKYYKNLKVVQKTNEDDKDWICGPCNDLGRCPYPVINQTLKCFSDLKDELVESEVIAFINKLNI
jgi:ADP-heptose:LPS heptosyltransferase